MKYFLIFAAGVLHVFACFGVLVMLFLGFVTFCAIFFGGLLMVADFIGVFKANDFVFYWWPWWCVGFVAEFAFYVFFVWMIDKTDTDTEIDKFFRAIRR